MKSLTRDVEHSIKMAVAGMDEIEKCSYCTPAMISIPSENRIENIAEWFKE
jgi:hypothetical protein